MTFLRGRPHGGIDRKRLICIAGQLALWLVISLAFLHLPETPPMDPELDASWNLCLRYFFQHGMQFGTDVVFTYGPLGFVTSLLYWGSGFWLQIVANAAESGMFAWILLETVRPLKWPPKIIAILAVVLVISGRGGVIELLMVALLGLLLLRYEAVGKLKIAACCVILGFLSLTKFTNLMQAAAIVTIAAGYYCLDRKWRRGALVAGGFALALLAWWIGCGQSASGLGRWLRNSLEISSAYTDAMFMDEKFQETLTGLSTLALLASYGVFEAAAAKRRVKGFATVLIFWAATFLGWKHSFVRAEETHIFGFYLWALTPVVLNPVFFPDAERWRAVRIGFLVAIALCAIGGIHRLNPKAISGCVSENTEKFRKNLSTLTNLPGFKRELDSRYAELERKNAASRIVQAVGEQTVDVFGFEQYAAILNGLNYTPRPVFQSYVAYTPKLAGLNAAFMAGNKAPEWILQRYETIDHRYPSTDDGPALRALLDRYTFQFQDSGYVVWRRAENKDKVLTMLPPAVREGDATIDQEIPVGDIATNSGLWLEVSYSYTLAGSLRELLYKPPTVRLVVTTANQPDLPRKFRFPRFLAQEGTLLSPYLPTEYDFLRYAVGLGGPKVQSFKVRCSRENKRYLHRTFHYRLTILPDPYNLSANRALANLIRQYPMFEAVPSRVEAASPPSSVGVDGRNALEVRAPSQIELSIPPGGRRLLGWFGLKTDAPSADGGKNDKRPAAEFQIIVREGAARRVLFDRVLKPREVPGDQGLQPFDVALPAVPPGSTLVLNAISKTSTESGGDSTCWTGVRIQ